MTRLRISSVLLLAALLRPSAALGCAACFGKSDSPLAHGMNWGIAAMLVVVVGMWIAFGSFFVFLARRASKTGEPGPSSPSTSETRRE